MKLELEVGAAQIRELAFARPHRCTRVFLALLLFLVAASTERLAAQVPTSPPITSTPSCASCSIAIRGSLTLTLPDSLSFSPTARVLRLPARRGYLIFGEATGGLNETPVPALLDTAGRFVRLIARVGDGPGEIRRVMTSVVSTGDSVWVIGNRARNVFSPEINFVRRDPYPSARNVVVGSAGQDVISAFMGTPQQAGLPLHVVSRNGTILQSFGSNDVSIDPRRLEALGDDIQNALLRELMSSPDGTLWAFSTNRFVLEQYRFDGRLIYRAQRSLDGWYKEASERMPGMGEFKGVPVVQVQSSVDPNVVWLIYYVPNASFAPPAADRPFVMATYAAMRDVVVEAFHVRTRQVLASRRFAGTIALSVQNAPDVLAFLRSMDRSAHTYELVTLTLARSQPPF